MKNIWNISLLLWICAIPALSFAQEPNMDFRGFWLTEEDKAVVEIVDCMENSLCGYIYWFREKDKDRDIHNPDPALRDRPTCGLPLLWGFHKESEDLWEGGEIYKADDGDTYTSNMRMLEDGRLKVKGYIGIPLLSQSQVWERVDPRNYPRCQKP